MKKILAMLLALIMVLSLCACGSTSSGNGEGAVSADNIPDEMTSADGKYQVAFITDVGALKDQSFNQGTYDGVKLYASANGKSYKYYQPANGDQATDQDRIDAMLMACENGAEVVVAAGFMQETALKAAAEANPDVNFVFRSHFVGDVVSTDSALAVVAAGTTSAQAQDHDQSQQHSQNLLHVSFLQKISFGISYTMGIVAHFHQKINIFWNFC